MQDQCLKCVSFRSAELPQLPKSKLKIWGLQCLAPYRQQHLTNENSVWRSCYWKIPCCVEWLRIRWRLSQQLCWTKSSLAVGEGPVLFCGTIALCLCSPPYPLRILANLPCPSQVSRFPTLLFSSVLEMAFNLFLQAAVPLAWYFPHHGLAEPTACLVVAWADDLSASWVLNVVAAELFPKL